MRIIRASGGREEGRGLDAGMRQRRRSRRRPATLNSENPGARDREGFVTVFPFDQSRDGRSNATFFSKSRPSWAAWIAADGEGRENRPQSRYGIEPPALISNRPEQPEGTKHSRISAAKTRGPGAGRLSSFRANSESEDPAAVSINATAIIA
jgi:hypothetical protein